VAFFSQPLIVMPRFSTPMPRLVCSKRLQSSSAATLPLKYFSAWFCPFAHRATLALEHHADAVPYEWEEALGWEQRAPSGNEEFSAADRQDWWYHWKSPGLLKANPSGMVPTLLDEQTGRAVTESCVAVEFIDELAAIRGGMAPSLLPADPYERARMRVAADQVNKAVCSSYYKVLVRTGEEDRRAGFAALLDGLRGFSGDLRDEPATGAFWGGRSSLGLVDCVLLPYAYRLYVLEHYRGTEFALPTEGEGGLWQKYQRWLQHATATASVARTLPDKARYLRHVAKYAEGKARSKVGNAVRRGVSAHEYDHTVDGDRAEPSKS